MEVVNQYHINKILTLYYIGQEPIQIGLRFYHHIAGLAALAGAYNTGCFQLVHQAAGAVVTQFHPPL